MACLREETSCSLSEMASNHLVIDEEGEGTKTEVSGLKAVEYRLDTVFPWYAMGNSKADDESSIDAANSECPGVSDLIWDAVISEAKLEAEREPILSSVLYANILSHNCLERALCFVLANRLQNPIILATQLMDIFDDVMMHDRGIQRSIRLDLQAFMDRDPASISYCSALLYLKGFHCLQAYRVAHALWNNRKRLLALTLQSLMNEVFGVDIHPAAKIGDGILLDDATGVVIGETTIVGNRVSLMQGVTLGGTGKETGNRHPKIGQGALIGASATILGNIKIGEGAMIAAGSLVLKDVTPHSMVAGNPARVIGYVQEQDPSLTMNHDATKEFFQQVAVNLIDGRSNEVVALVHAGIRLPIEDSIALVLELEKTDSPCPIKLKGALPVDKVFIITEGGGKERHCQWTRFLSLQRLEERKRQLPHM